MLLYLTIPSLYCLACYWWFYYVFYPLTLLVDLFLLMLLNLTNPSPYWLAYFGWCYYIWLSPHPIGWLVLTDVTIYDYPYTLLVGFLVDVTIYDYPLTLLACSGSCYHIWLYPYPIVCFVLVHVTIYVTIPSPLGWLNLAFVTVHSWLFPHPSVILVWLM